MHAGAAHSEYFRHHGHRGVRHPGRRGDDRARRGGARENRAAGGRAHDGGDEGHPSRARPRAPPRGETLRGGAEIRERLYGASPHRARPVHHHCGRADPGPAGRRRGAPPGEAGAPRGRRHQHGRLHARHGSARPPRRGRCVRPGGHPRRRGCGLPEGHPLSGETAPFPGQVSGKLFAAIRDFYGII